GEGRRERCGAQWFVGRSIASRGARPPHARVFVATDAPEILRGLLDPEARVDEQVVWRDAASGEELARSETLPTQMQIGSPLAPGFFGVWYYLGTNGEIVELSVSDARQVTACRR
ncbi:MAG: hypothetical protein AAFZ18_14060, partial [Myxococcota bacterium]